MGQLGKWISNKTAKPFYARRAFEVKRPVKKATAYVCGLGQFHFYCNGEKAGNHELDPGWTNYDKLVQYVVFDLTDSLNVGMNAVGMEVGNGWYHMDRERYFMSMPPNRPEFSFMPPNPNQYQPFGEYLVLSFKLVLEYRNGEAQEILSDEQVQVCPHYVTMANIFGSEIIDGRYRQSGFSKPDYEAANWEAAVVLETADCPKGSLVRQTQPPIRVKNTYDAVLVRTIGEREIYDFTQNMSGILEFEAKGKKGDVIHVYPAEKLGADGDVDQMAKGWTPIDVCITYVIGADDVWEKCRMKFTYFAGRYIAVVRERQNESEAHIEIRDIKADYITSDCRDVGGFTCDDKRFEQIYDLVRKAVESNLLSVHTDCPSIERYAWQEPNHLMGPSIMYMKEVKALWEKILTDLRVDQCTKDEWYQGLNGERHYPGEGMMPSQAPCYEHNVLPVPGIGNFHDIIPWGSTCILGAYWHYMFYGDRQMLEDNYEAGKKYFAYLKTKRTDDGFINYGLGDWGSPDKDALARENVETVFLYADAVTLAKFAAVLGKETEQAEFEKDAEQIKDNYNEKLLKKHPTEGFYYYQAWDHPDEVFLTQACEAMPLYWGMVPEDKTEDVVKALRYVLDRDQSFVSGEIGLPYIIQTMAKYGLNSQIEEFILRCEHPSYYAFVLAGETTLGEYWEENPRSHNHDMMGSIMEWYYNGIAGIRPIRAGFAEVLIKPWLPQALTEFTCSYESVQGQIQVKVTEESEKISVELQIPKGVEYTFDDSMLKSRKAWIEVKEGNV